MTDEQIVRKILNRILVEQPEDDMQEPLGIPYDDPEDWTSPTGRKSNAYIIAEKEAMQNPLALLQRLGTTVLENPKTNTVKDVENFLRQVIMKHPDLSQVYGKVTSSEGNIYVDRRPAPVDIRFDFDESSSKNFVTSNASAARYISLLMVAGGMLGWVKFKPGVDTVMFGGVDDSKIRVVPKSYGAGPVATRKAAAPAPSAPPAPQKSAPPAPQKKT